MKSKLIESEVNLTEVKFYSLSQNKIDVGIQKSLFRIFFTYLIQDFLF